MNKIIKLRSQQKGFTLVEMIVALAIFAIVALVAIGALLKVVDANKKSQSLKTAINNLNFALESMSREMRVGANYACNSNSIVVNDNVVQNQSCIDKDNASSWIVAFNSSKTSTSQSTGKKCNLVIAYKYDKPTVNGTIKKYEQTSCDVLDDVNSSGNYVELISPSVYITDSIMRVNSNITERPKAFFWFKGYTGARERDKTEFELQTTVSQRSGN